MAGVAAGTCDLRSCSRSLRPIYRPAQVMSNTSLSLTTAPACSPLGLGYYYRILGLHLSSTLPPLGTVKSAPALQLTPHSCGARSSEARRSELRTHSASTDIAGVQYSAFRLHRLGAADTVTLGPHGRSICDNCVRAPLCLDRHSLISPSPSCLARIACWLTS